MTTEAELAALRDRIAGVLTGPISARISFSFPTLQIRPGGFVVIGMSLASPPTASPAPAARRRMSVRVDRHMPSGVGAEYIARTNTLSVPHAQYGITIEEQSGIVHEATHAVFDYYRMRATAYVEEAAAYVAESIYCHHLRMPRATSGIQAVSDVIAARICGPQRIGGAPNSVVTQAEVNRLVSAIASSSTYRDLGRTHRYRQDGGAI